MRNKLYILHTACEHKTCFLQKGRYRAAKENAEYKCETDNEKKWAKHADKCANCDATKAVEPVAEEWCKEEGEKSGKSQ